MPDVKIAASLLAANPCCLKKEIDTLESAGVDYLHIDIMDGRFVPNLTFGPHIVKELRKYSNLEFDVHLMLKNPLKSIEMFANSGADLITIHAEIDEDIKEIATLIHRFGKRAGLSIKPSTEVKKIEKYIDLFDVFLIMTVEPGWGGQKYLDSTTRKIERLRRELDNHEGKDIEVDGGIKIENIEIPVKAGANIVVAGSGIFATPSICRTVKKMRKIANHARKSVGETIAV